ncbi:hypothetical protein [Paenibacillus sp. J2TS4]|uniref:hypothetical protein n=1 Tax=Paenibacillus sp. J2TS4 TaxID=2807194 RepID=UPI001B2C7845|nr:hypothetical protein [Paenibacillus sp. J2TS4]GIP35584.1 hypothetical protein J2TS4_47940 [Paenibacillus sp. J2TS4]
MKSKWTLIVAPALLGVGLWLGSIVTTSADSGTGQQPGTVDDPLVTKSYVDQQIKAITGGSPVTVDNDIEKIKEEILKELKDGSATTPGVSQGIQVVELNPGQILYAAPGSEVIVRNGNAVAVSSDDNGIPDVTSGKDLSAGTVVELNHLLLFPREGRGIQSDSSNKEVMFVMVKGNHMVVNEDGSKVTP